MLQCSRVGSKYRLPAHTEIPTAVIAAVITAVFQFTNALARIRSRTWVEHPHRLRFTVSSSIELAWAAHTYRYSVCPSFSRCSQKNNLHGAAVGRYFLRDNLR